MAYWASEKAFKPLQRPELCERTSSLTVFCVCVCVELSAEKQREYVNLCSLFINPGAEFAIKDLLV